MVQTECYETSAYKIHTQRNYPEENINLSEHGEMLKSRIVCYFFTDVSGQPIGPILKGQAFREE